MNEEDLMIALEREHERSPNSWSTSCGRDDRSCLDGVEIPRRFLSPRLQDDL